MYDERLVHHIQERARRERISFRSVLAFENFILLMAVVFGLQFIDRTFGPVLPLYVAELGTAVERVPLVAGILFSITAGTGALGNQVAARLLRRVPARNVIAGSALTGALGALLYVIAPRPWWLFVATPLFGLAMGVASTAAYTAASSVMPVAARGAGFGLLTTAALTGVAISPIISGFLGATSIRAVFVLDVVALALLAAVVSRLMVSAPLDRPTSPAVEEL
jgi:MFS transporter, DHA1 family, multidrug resistance protein